MIQKSGGSTQAYPYFPLSLYIYIYIYMYLSLSLSLSLYIYIYMYRYKCIPQTRTAFPGNSGWAEQDRTIGEHMLSHSVKVLPQPWRLRGHRICRRRVNLCRSFGQDRRYENPKVVWTICAHGCNTNCNDPQVSTTDLPSVYDEMNIVRPL